MPPSKRKPRRSKASELKADTSDVEMPDSSPTRPSAKKRKTNSGRASRKEKDISPEPTLPFQQDQFDDDDDEEPDAEGSSNDLMDKVISHLTISRDPVTVAREHANEGADTTGKVSAFAKIAGRDWTYYVRELTINIGRPPDDRQGSAHAAGASSPIQDLKDHFPVHIDLGPSKIISRHHAAITYDADLPRDEGSWNVRVNGRNGVRVNNTLLKRGMRYQIKSGAVLEIAGTQMMFVLPGGKTEIDPYFVEKAEGLDNGIEFDQAASPSETEDKPSIGNELPGYQSLAPAPPNFKRASTPPPLNDGRGQRGVFDSKFTTSPMYGRGMMMESTQEIDYSRDAAKDLKPPYSYAHMIAQAIFSSEDQKLTLSNIYSFIADKYAFYRHSNSGWQNSIRHNLSLNKAFQKVPRRTDEPGKGMKWQIAPEYREEYWKKQQRRTGNSSNPSSPASNKDINPNFRGANGQNLGYDTSMVYQFPAKDAVGPSAPPKLNINMSFPPFPSNQPYANQGPGGPSSQPAPSTSTPQRRRTNTGNTLDESPLPHDYPSSAGADGRSQHPYYSLPMSAGPQTHHSPTGPTLSSSYLDTPFHPSQHSVVTPAPLRQNPKLAPPSTLVAPSKFMPESSPAGPGLFWKGFLGGTMTPGPASAIPPDMSPVKLDPDDRRRFNGLGRDIMSSSPPPMDDDGGMSGSPSKPARGRSATHTSSSAKKEGEALRLNGNPPFLPNPLSADANAKTNNASANSSMSSNVGPPPPASNQTPRLSVGPPSAPGLSGVNRTNTESKNEPQKEDEADDGEGEDGFDLARGFAPIGSFSQRSGVRS